MVLQNYQNFIEMTSNMIYIVALAVGLKCPCKIHLNTQCPGTPRGDRPGMVILYRNVIVKRTNAGCILIRCQYFRKKNIAGEEATIEDRP